MRNFGSWRFGLNFASRQFSGKRIDHVQKCSGMACGIVERHFWSYGDQSRGSRRNVKSHQYIEELKAAILKRAWRYRYAR